MRAGLDLSINGSGIYFEDGSIYYQSTVKKEIINTEKIRSNLVRGSKGKLDTLKYFENGNNIINICKEKGLTEVGIEGYAYGYKSTVGLVFSLAEFTGIVKCLLIQNNIKLNIFPPKQIKRFATENGSASKIKMVNKFFELEKESPLNEMKKRRFNIYESPCNDVIDAYWVYKLLISLN